MGAQECHARLHPHARQGSVGDDEVVGRILEAVERPPELADVIYCEAAASIILEGVDRELRVDRVVLDEENAVRAGLERHDRYAALNDVTVTHAIPPAGRCRGAAGAD